MAIYVVTHRLKNNELNINGYNYLLVGSYDKDENVLYMYRDCLGNNISLKNKNYCELTGLYWIWKNSDEKFVGLVHYRRFFTQNRFSEKYKFFYSEKKLENMLDKYDILISERQFVKDKNIREHYNRCHYKKDLECIREIIKEKYTDFLSDFDYVFSLKYFYPFNMFFSTKVLIDKYCKWLFDVLFDKTLPVVTLGTSFISKIRILVDDYFNGLATFFRKD